MTGEDNTTGFAISLHARPAEIEADWRRLEADGVCSYFQGYDWCETWCRVAAERAGETPLIIALRDRDGNCAAILPMATRRGRVFDALGWLAQDVSSHNMGLYRRCAAGRLSRDVLEGAFRRAVAARPRVALLNCQGQPVSWDGLDNPSAALPGSPNGQPLQTVMLEGGFEAFCRRRFRRKTRKDLERAETALASRGVVFTGSAGLPASETSRVFRAFAEQKAQQLARDGFETIYRRPEIAAFFEALIGNRPAGESIDAHALWDGDTLVAAAIGTRFRDRFHIVMLSMTTGPLRQFSPGRIVVQAAIRAAAEAGARTIDFGAGANELKKRWGCQPLARFDTIYALRPAGWPAAAAIRSARAAEVAIRNNPAAFAFAKRGVAAVRRAAGRLGRSAS